MHLIDKHLEATIDSLVWDEAAYTTVRIRRPFYEKPTRALKDEENRFMR